MSNVTIKKITPPTVKLLSPIGEVHEVNEYEFVDARVQIMQNKEHGWYVIVNDIAHEIDTDGRIEDYPKELFPFIVDALIELI